MSRTLRPLSLAMGRLEFINGTFIFLFYYHPIQIERLDILIKIKQDTLLLIHVFKTNLSKI